MRDQKWQCCFLWQIFSWVHSNIIRARKISNASICCLSRAEAAQIWPEALQVELQILWEDVNLWRVSLCQLLSTPPGHSQDYGDHLTTRRQSIGFSYFDFESLLKAPSRHFNTQLAIGLSVKPSPGRQCGFRLYRSLKADVKEYLCEYLLHQCQNWRAVLRTLHSAA